jgi:hypothetical protein
MCCDTYGVCVCAGLVCMCCDTYGVCVCAGLVCMCCDTYGVYVCAGLVCMCCDTYGVCVCAGLVCMCCDTYGVYVCAGLVCRAPFRTRRHVCGSDGMGDGSMCMFIARAQLSVRMMSSDSLLCRLCVLLLYVWSV